MHEFIYLLHFDDRRHHALHYLGSTGKLLARLKRHAEGHGARLTAALRTDGQEWQVAAIYQKKETATDSIKTLERKAKRRHNSTAYCPICSTKVKIPEGTMPYPLLLIRSELLREENGTP